MPKHRKSWYEIRNAKDGRPVNVVIEDEIGGWGVTAKQFRSDFSRIGKDEAVNIHIKSGGGSIFEGNEIANIIREHQGEVTVSLGSICASIATVVMCAGAKVTAAKNTLVMIHNPEVYCGGDSEELRKVADIMDKMKDGIVAAYAAKTGKDEDELAAAMDDETWMTAEEAKDFGFVDEISEEDAEDKVIDSVDLAHYKNISKLLQVETPNAIGVITGNGKNMTLAAIRNAANNPPSRTLITVQPKIKNTMTPEEIAAQKAEVTRLAKEEAQNIVKAQNARAKEIRDAVAMIAKRDKKDFTALADEYIADTEKSVDQFFRDVLTSDKFKLTNVVGSGIEVVEPLDHAKGTPGFLFVNSPEFKALADKVARGGPHQAVNLNLTVPNFQNATQTSTSPNTLTSIEYVPGIYALGVRQLRIKDLIMPGQTNATTVRYRYEDAFANAAAIVTETGALPNVAVSVHEADAAVTDLGGYIEMSENLLADYLAVASFINQRLPYMVERATEDALLNSASGLIGLLQASGIQTQAKGADSNVDALHKAITNVRFVPNAVQANAQGGYEPDAIVMNPTDWQLVRLAKDANNQYFAGGPFTGTYGNGAYSNVFSVWGKMVVVTPAIAAGTALVGGFRECSQYFQRQGVTIEMTNSNGTNFINRIVTLRAAERLALAVPLPNGFCQVTGLA